MISIVSPKLWTTSTGAATLLRLCSTRRFCSAAAAAASPPSLASDGNRKMGAWQVHAYGNVADELQYSDRVKIPAITDANDVLVRISAASLNGIDLEMASGRGAVSFNAMRRCNEQNIEFPLTLGRDFVGIVEHKGMAVREGLRIGDCVWGTVPFHRAGSHAEYTVLDANFVSASPANVTAAAAAASLYAGLTAWSGLFLSGQLGGLTGATSSLGGGRGKRVCILGASGGVGHLAVQMCRAEGAAIVATCAADARDAIERLDCCEQIVDYRNADAGQQLVAGGPYDIVLDCAGKGAAYAAQLPWKYGQYVTLTSPLLGNNDEYGLVGGSVRNVLELLNANWRSVSTNGGLVKWAYVAACPHAVDYLRRLLEGGMLVPTIEQTFGFLEADAAYRRLAEGHLRGKIVLQM